MFTPRFDSMASSSVTHSTKRMLYDSSVAEAPMRWLGVECRLMYAAMPIDTARFSHSAS